MTWHPPRFAFVDPLKDRQAEALALKIGTKSRSQAVSEEGRDIEELDNEIKMDNDREKELGLSFEFSSQAPAKTTAGTLEESTPPSDLETEDTDEPDKEEEAAA